jgi:uncharacterized protein (TIGR00725 family)
MMRKTIIGVIGAGQVSDSGYAVAREVGRRIGEGGAVLVCGGLSGVMEAACRGCKEGGGETLGLLPGGDAAMANPYVTLAVPTNMGHARNVIIAHTAQVLIAVEGEYGTLSEIAVALKLGKPVVALNSWPGIEGVIEAASAEEAVAIAMQLATGQGET